MAQFIGEIQGHRGRASRLGSKTSGFYAHIRGWDIGVEVECSHNNGRDIIDIYQTCGSNNHCNRKLIKSLEE